jgi:MFS family permease
MTLVSRLKEEFSFFRGNYLILIATWLIMDITGEIPASFFELYVLELGGTVAIIGLINFSLKIAFAAVCFPGGYIADKFGRKGIIVVATLGNGVCQLLYAAAPDWRYILIALVLGNLTRISNPALQAMTADAIPPKKRGLGFSIQQITLDMTSTPAPLLATMLFDYFGFVPGMRVAYAIVAVSYFVASLMRLRLTETLENAERISLRELLLAFPRSYVASFKMIFTIPKALRNLIVTNNLFAFAGSFFGSYIIVYATSDLGLSKSEWGIILTAQAVLTTLLVVPIGKAIDIFGAKKMMIIFNMLIIATLILTIYANFAVFLVVMPLMGIAYSAAGVGFQKLTAGLTQRNLRGKMVGLFRFFSLIVGAMGSLLGGLTYENSAHTNVFIVGIVTMAISTILFIRLVNPPQQEEL